MTRTNDATAPAPTEFHRLAANWIDDMANDIAIEYPITASVAIVAGIFFGFFCVLHLSISAMISGAFFIAIGATTAMAVQRNWDAFWASFKNSAWEVKDWLMSKKNDPAPPANATKS